MKKRIAALAIGLSALAVMPALAETMRLGDSAAVTGRADPVQTITKLNDRIAALEAAATNITE